MTKFILPILAVVFHSQATLAGRDGNGDWPTNARRTLEKVSGLLADKIATANEDQFRSLLNRMPPANTGKDSSTGIPLIPITHVNPKMVSALIKNIRQMSNADLQKAQLSIQRFYYGLDAGGYFIRALPAYYLQFGLLPMESMDARARVELQKLLLLETSHLWGYNDSQAEEFAKNASKLIFGSELIDASTYNPASLLQWHKDQIRALSVAKNVLDQAAFSACYTHAYYLNAKCVSAKLMEASNLLADATGIYPKAVAIKHNLYESSRNLRQCIDSYKSTVGGPAYSCDLGTSVTLHPYDGQQTFHISNSDLTAIKTGATNRIESLINEMKEKLVSLSH